MNVGRVCSNKVYCRCVAIATPTRRFTIDRDMRSVTCSKASLNPTANACLEHCDVDPPENTRVGGFAQPAPASEPQEVQELPTSLFAVLSDRLVAGHTRKHGDNGEREKGRKRVSLTLSATRILNALKEFQQ